MPGGGEILASLYGAWRLLWLDKNGLGYFDGSREACIRSFYAALLALPAYVILVALHFSAVDTEFDTLHLMIVHALAFVVSWTAYPLVMHNVAGHLGREQRYFGFVTVFNWTRVLRVWIILLATLIAASGLLPETLAKVLTLTAWIGVFGYQWFITRLALDVEGLPAGFLVALEVGIGLCISVLANQVLT